MEKLPKRKCIRLKDFDYTQAGYYFITICAKDRKSLFWNDVGATCGRPFEPSLTKIGKIIDLEINKINCIYENIEINKYVIMPNHVHLIIVLHTENGQSKIDKQESGRPQVAPTISRIIQQFKGSISKQVGFLIWQKSFYEHVIRNEEEYLNIYNYIESNPLKWEEDKYYI